MRCYMLVVLKNITILFTGIANNPPCTQTLVLDEERISLC